MSALPMQPTERDRERFRDLTKAMQFGLEYDRRLAYNGDYTDPQTVAMFRLWWSVERERQLLQNLNMSQGCKLSELLARAEKAEAELVRMRDQKPVAWINLNKWTPSNGPRCVTHEEYEKQRELSTRLTAVYTAPVTTVAEPAVPEEWRNIVIEMLGWWDDQTMIFTQGKAIGEKARALLQSAPQSSSETVAHHPV